MNWKTGIDKCTLLYIEQIADKDLLYSTGNSVRCSVMACVEGESEAEWTCMWKIHCAVHLELT